MKLAGDRNQCRGCNTYFKSTAAFDKHRVGKHGVYEGPLRRRCLTPVEMVEKGMVLREDGFWRSKPAPESLTEQHRALQKALKTEGELGGWLETSVGGVRE